MTVERAIELLEIERNCVYRNSQGNCNRDCYSCDLVQDDGELLEMYAKVIALLKSREPANAKVSNGTGPTRSYVCGVCSEAIDPGDKYCRMCGIEVRWRGSN